MNLPEMFITRFNVVISLFLQKPWLAMLLNLIMPPSLPRPRTPTSGFTIRTPGRQPRPSRPSHSTVPPSIWRTWSPTMREIVPFRRFMGGVGRRAQANVSPENMPDFVMNIYFQVHGTANEDGHSRQPSSSSTCSRRPRSMPSTRGCTPNTWSLSTSRWSFCYLRFVYWLLMFRSTALPHRT